VEETVEKVATKEVETNDEIIHETVDTIEADITDTGLEEEVLDTPEEIEEPETKKIDFAKIVKYDPLKELEALQVNKTPKENALSFDTVVYNPEKELTKLIDQKEEVKEKGEQDFASWLNNIGDDTSTPVGESKSPDKVQHLLDQFLATKRTRPIQNRTFYNAQNKAEESETDNMDVLSETLLELYVKQGHYAKAIGGYEKLSLQNPEKSAYFAARIKELQELQKE
jgi:hypothetical protein